MEERERKGTENHPYYDLDSGSPHMAPEDYEKAGLGPFDPTQGAPPQNSGDPEDEALRQAVENNLQGHDGLDVSRVEVRASGGQIVLMGVLGDVHSKRRAEVLAREVEGVKDVRSELRVQAGETSGGPVLTTHEPGVLPGSTQRS